MTLHVEGSFCLMDLGRGFFSLSHMDFGHSLNHIQSRLLVIGLQEKIHKRVLSFVPIF